jgi:tape measure domain-containing protein
LTGLGGFGLTIAASNEQAMISFETMLGSAEKAGSFLTDLKDFAARTPFEFPELQKAASSLISVGFNADKVLPIMTTLGDVTAGMGTGSEGVKRATVALQQMSAAGKITGQDLNQLRDAGVPVFDLLAGATGKTKEELSAMAQSGKLGRTEMEQLFTALETGAGLERFSGLMEKQSQSLIGLISTMKDTIGQGLADAMAPAIPQIKALLPGITDALGGMIGAIAPVMTQIVTALVPVVQALLPLIAPILASLGELFVTFLSPLLPVIQQLAPFVAEFVDILAKGLNGALGKILPPLGELLVAIAPLLPPIAELAASLIGLFADALAAILPDLIPVIQTLVTGLTPVLVALAPIFSRLMEALAPLWPVLTEIAGVVAELLVEALQALVPILPILLDAIIPMIPLWAEFMRMLLPLVKIILQLTIAVSALVLEGFALLLKEGSKLYTSMLKPILAIIRPVVDAFIQFFEAIGSGDWGKIGEAFVNLVGKIASAWNDLRALLFEKLGEIFSAVASWITTTAGPWLLNAAAELPGNLVNWIGTAVAWLVPKLGEWLAALGGWLVSTALPWMIDKGIELAVAFLRWIPQALMLMPRLLVGLLVSLGEWIGGTAVPWVIDKVKELAAALLGFIVDAAIALPGKLAEFAQKILDFIGGLPSRIADAAKDMFVGLANAFIRALNWLLQRWNELEFKTPDIPGTDWGGQTIRMPGLRMLPELAGLAKGGPVRAGTPAIVGEEGPELWWPRSTGTIVPGAGALGSAASTGIQVGTINVTGASEPRESAYAIRSELRWLAITGGRQ